MSQCFDLICGTSTGAIVASAVATNTDPKRVIELFRREGPEIFRQSRVRTALGKLVPTGLLSSRYRSDRLQKALCAVLGESRLDEAATKLCIPAYDIAHRRTFYFRSYDSDTENIELWKACLASSAAPTYFPIQMIEIATGDERYFIDGGVSANNPSGLGLAEGISLLRKNSLKETEEARDVQLISLGTGSSTRNLTGRLEGTEGAVGWASSILDVMFDGSSDVSNHIAEQLLDNKSYVRLQFDLDLGKGSDDLDNTSVDNLRALQAAAANHIQHGEGKAKFNQILNLLKPPKLARNRKPIGNVG